MVARLVHEYWSTKGPDASHQNTPVPQSYMERLLLAVKQSECADPAAPVSVEPMIEPLTRKEIEVLRLMSEGFSNRVLAERMFVTEATTRTHLRNINVKLGVHSRVQAIAIARRKGLIP